MNTFLEEVLNGADYRIFLDKCTTLDSAITLINEVKPEEIPYDRSKIKLQQIEFYTRKRFYDPNEMQNIDGFVKSLNRWVDFVIKPESNPFFSGSRLDKEEEIKNILFDNDGKDIFRFFKKTEIGKGYIDFLINNWFLRRYDLTTVEFLIKKLDKGAIIKDERTRQGNRFLIFIDKMVNKLKQIGKYYNYIFMIIIPFLISYLFVVNPYLISNFNFNYIFPLCLTNGEILLGNQKHILINYRLFLILIEIILVLVTLGYTSIVFFKPTRIYLYLPRLIIGIIVGYLPLLTGDIFWKIGIRSHPIIIAVISVVTIAGCYFYLRYEVMKSIGITHKDFLQRVVRILARGVVYSFTIGFFILDIFYAQYLSIIEKIPSDEIQYRLDAGLLGIIDPFLLLFFAPLALFIGMVIQFIWEEKPITFPVK